MARRIREEDLQAIEEVVRQHPEGRTAQQRIPGSIALLRDVFIWAYERSAARYAAVRQSLGESDPFRMRHRTARPTGSLLARDLHHSEGLIERFASALPALTIRRNDGNMAT